MTDWRALAEKEQWWSIQYFQLDVADQVELRDLLQSILPETTRGHGVESYVGPIAPRDAVSWEQHEAASFLQFVERKLAEDECLKRDPVCEAVAFARASLLNMGLDFEGWHDTYLYWDPSELAWIQLPSADGRSIEEHRFSLEQEICKLPQKEAVAAYRTLDYGAKPWRQCQRLSSLFRFDRFEPYTPFWHALNVLNWNDALLEASHSDDEGLSTAIISAFEIGRSYQALEKKPYEKHALRGIRTLKAARAGGEYRRNKLAAETQATLAEMLRLIHERPEMSISWAAQTAKKNGHGASAAANRTAWYRQKRKNL